MLRTIAFGIAGAVVVAAATGCVPQDKYDNLLTSHRTLQEENVALEDQIEAKQASLEMLQQRVAASQSQLQNLEATNQRLRTEIEQMGGDYEALASRLNNMQVGPLPEEVNEALQALAAQHPDLLTYDAKNGMVRFASDFTFALGSTALQPQAKESIQALAGILNTASIANYEIKVVGHTDSVPISKPETRAKHPTNTHLSVHRAISVRDALVNANVAAGRIQVAGYGPYRPRVAEGSSGGAAPGSAGAGAPPGSP